MADGAACVDTRRASITGSATGFPAGGATCTSAITIACSPSEIHMAASGRRSCGGMVGASKEAFTRIFGLRRKADAPA